MDLMVRIMDLRYHTANGVGYKCYRHRWFVCMLLSNITDRRISMKFSRYVGNDAIIIIFIVIAIIIVIITVIWLLNGID